MVTRANQYKHDLTAPVDEPSTLIFYYGPAAQRLQPLWLAHWPAASHRLCSAAWARAGRPALPEALQPMGLVSALDHALKAEVVISVAERGIQQGHGGEAVLCWFNQAPTTALADDWLALVMAAAALEVPVTVHLSGPAVGLLEGAFAPRWQQLEAHDLATVVVQSGAPTVGANQCLLQP
jgi:hypothetical protein